MWTNLFKFIFLRNMATASVPTHVSHTESDEMHLEIFCLVWLDASSSGKDGRDTEQQLRSIIERTSRYDRQRSSGTRNRSFYSSSSTSHIDLCLLHG